MGAKPVVFMIIPFDEDFLALYAALKERFAGSYEFVNAGDMDNQQSILKDIVVGIYSADVIIADLTGLNANVFYELGLAHAMNKNVVIITQDIEELPFDIRPYRANQYSMQFYKVTQLYTELEKLLAGSISGEVKFGNPVSDYVKNIQILTEQDATQVAVKIENADTGEDVDEDEAKGFLDFIADIEESMAILSSEIDSMREDMNEMTVEIVDATHEINRVKTTGGSSIATFTRNVSRKLSEPVDKFALQMKAHTSVISNNWSKIENSYLALLDDERIRTYENTEGMKTSMDSLKDMQTAIYGSDEKIEIFIESLKTNLGMERRLTRAIMSLITELQGYLSMTDTMASSIDRIVSRSKIVFSQVAVEA